MRAFLIALLVAMPTAAIAQTDPGLQQCAVMPSPAARLNCYDALARTRAQQPPAIGTIQICRTPGVQGLHQEDSIEIPEGATMVNFGEKSPSVSGSLGIVILATTAASVLMHGKPCVKVAAKVKENPKQRPIVAGLPFRPQGGSGDPRGQWAIIADYQITVAEDFK